MRIVTAGSVPPALGGETMGGVASVHANLLRQYEDVERFGIEVSAVFAGNLGTAGPFHPLLANIGLDHRTEERVFVQAAQRADAVLIFHVAHRFGTYWQRNPGMPPLIARVPSWTGLGPDTPDKVAIVRRRLDAARAVALGSRQLLDEGLQAGYLGTRENAYVVPDTLDEQFLVPVTNCARPKHVIFVGRLDENKGPIPLLYAMKLLPEWSATIVGTGPLTDEVRQVHEALGLQGRVELQGPITDRAALRKLLEEASVLCVPSRREAFGTVYIEAMASGTFAVGLAACLKEIGEDLGLPCGEGVRSQDPHEIATAIETAAALATDRRELAERAQSYYPARRCAEGMARAISAAVHSRAT
jgi:glycosyltransferase involved in cell wall biosynthesis